jgi:hypothetical protein
LRTPKFLREENLSVIYFGRYIKILRRDLLLPSSGRKNIQHGERQPFVYGSEAKRELMGTV